MGRFGETVDIASPLFARLGSAASSAPVTLTMSVSSSGVDLGAVSDDHRILAQAVTMRLSTKRGALWTDPTYGLAVQDYLEAELTVDAIARIPHEVEAELEKDERIASAAVVATTTRAALGGVALKLAMTITPSPAPSFPMTRPISELTVEALTRGAS